MSKQQAGIFDEQFKLEHISKLDYPLEKLTRCYRLKNIQAYKALIIEAKAQVAGLPMIIS